MKLTDCLVAADPLAREEPLPPDVVMARRRALLQHERTRSAVPSSTGWHWRRHARLLAGAAILFLLGGSLLWRLSPPAVAAVRLEVRLAEDRPAPGLVAQPVAGSDRTVYLHADAVVTNEDVEGATVVDGSRASRFNVEVRLTPLGGAKLQQATATHIGRPVALLLDGQVIMAPVVRSPIGDTATITGDYAREEAE